MIVTQDLRPAHHPLHHCCELAQMSSRDVSGQPGRTKISVTIDYLLVLLHIATSFEWFMQAQVETQGLFVPDGRLSLARNIIHTKTRGMHSRRYACGSPNNNHFRNQRYCLWWVLRDVVGSTPSQKSPRSRARGRVCAGSSSACHLQALWLG